MSQQFDMKIVSAWRIQEGDPPGLTMWFDPSKEVPLLGILPPEQREEGEVVAMCQVRMELSEDRGVGTCEGVAARMSGEDSEWPGEPPQAFLDSLWEGYDG